ncbi:glyoxylate/hydroxypyruvate reductase HPR3-like [Papaver somniferum]|uniref:glyoxylate/hydroxypyruvate reductase HPR3-like n=1 Tax=Papaver somniferum TaxID=3469 RepID=UPI000E705DFB|nr:glyoxylate/hydroxypyruvate reductase HPR3-like [Papaver somniferum]
MRGSVYPHVKPFPYNPSFQEKFSNKFRTLKGTDLSIPVNEFLIKECQSVKALVRGAKFALSKDILDCLPSLGCIVLNCVGLDHIDLAECRKRGIVIGNAGAVYSEDVADLAIGLLLDVLRGISSGNQFVRSGLWPINKEFPLGSKDVMLALGKKGIIINVGRGPLVDEKEMVRLLVQGEIGGAGLDVFEKEPHVPKELFELDNVVLAAHIGWKTEESNSALHELVISNLEAFFSNKPLLSPVRRVWFRIVMLDNCRCFGRFRKVLEHTRNPLCRETQGFLV